MSTPRLRPGGAASPRTHRISCPPALHDQLLQQARLRAPAEACWALGGDAANGTGTLRRAVLLEAAPAPVDRFAIDAVAFARAEHDLRELGLRWLGFAHSHPGHRARLSQQDHDELWRGCLQLVVALPAAAPPELAAFWLHASGADRLALEYSAP